MVPMSETRGIAVIGAGVVGCAVARELAALGEEVFVIERNLGVTRGENQSTRNSGVIHAGLYYDRKTRPLKAALCARGNALLYEFCQRHGVPALRCGKLVVAWEEEQRAILDAYRSRAEENGVPVRVIQAQEAMEMEPQVKAVAALHLPSSGVVDSAALVYKLHVLASNDGAAFLTGTELVAARPRAQGIELDIRYRDGARDRVMCGRVINCAGLYSDEVARFMDPASPYESDLLRAEAAKFYRTKREDVRLRGMNVYPTPHLVRTEKGAYFTVGVHLTPTLDRDAEGRMGIGPVVTVGPLNVSAAHREDYGGEHRPMRIFHERVAPFFPGLKEEDLSPHQVGIQARLVGHPDWLVAFSSSEPRWLNLLGIDSPGLTGSLALAKYVKEVLFEKEKKTVANASRQERGIKETG